MFLDAADRNIRIAGDCRAISLIGFNLSVAISEASIEKNTDRNSYILQFQIECRSRTQIFLLYRDHCMCFCACPRSASSHSVDKSAPRMIDLQKYSTFSIFVATRKDRFNINCTVHISASWFKIGIETSMDHKISAKNQIAIRLRRYCAINKICKTFSCYWENMGKRGSRKSQHSLSTM